MSDEPYPARRELQSILEGFVPTIDALDLTAADAAARLETAHPFEGETMERVRALCEAGMEEGWLVPRQGGPDVRFGRLAKDLGGYSVDCVLMSGAALGHTHPKGEINIGFAWEGEDPRFDGHPAGWVVYPPGSHHVPTVTDGRMLFVYFMPGGEVEWDRREEGPRASGVPKNA